MDYLFTAIPLFICVQSRKVYTDAYILSRSLAPRVVIVGIVEILTTVNIQHHQVIDPEISTVIQALDSGGAVPHPFKHQVDRLVVKDGVLFR